MTFLNGFYYFLCGQLILFSLVNCDCEPGESPIGVTFSGSSVEITCKKLACPESKPVASDKINCFSTFAEECGQQESVGAVELGTGGPMYKCCAQLGLQRKSNPQKMKSLASGQSFEGKEVALQHNRKYHDIITDVTLDEGTKTLTVIVTAMPCRLMPSPVKFLGRPDAGLIAGLQNGLTYGLRYGLDNTNTNTNPCFSRFTTVETPTGQKLLTELTPLDRVMTVLDTGIIRYEPVLYFLHRDDDQVAKFVEIQTNSGKTLQLTEKHVIYKVNCNSLIGDFDHRSDRQLYFADELSVGDCVLQYTANGKLEIDTVAAIGSIYLKGIYSPMTSSGVIVTNGIVASCFSTVKDGSLFMRLKVNYELFHNLLDWINYKLIPDFGPSLVVEIPRVFGFAMDSLVKLYQL